MHGGIDPDTGRWIFWDELVTQIFKLQTKQATSHVKWNKLLTLICKLRRQSP